MEGDSLATLLILTSAFMHAVWNAAVRVSTDRFATVVFVTTVGGLLYIPFIGFAPLPAPEIWPWIAASAICHLAYQLCLARMMDKGALTLVYPIARGTGPLLVALFVYFFIDNGLTLVELIIIVCLVAGIFMTIHSDKTQQPAEHQAVIAAMLTGFAIAAYTLIDGIAVQKAEVALTYILWSGIAAAPLIFLLGIKQRGIKMIASTMQVWRQGLPASFMAHGGYSIALYAFSIGNLGEIAALRETSIVFATFIGIFWLKERTTPKRIIAAGIIALSAIALKAF